MQISVNYLKKFFSFSHPQELAEKLTNAGFEVGSISGLDYQGLLVVGVIRALEVHPEASNLQVCQVDIGDQELQIVCGGSNVALGALVVVARVGCVLPHLTIKKSKIRGVVSEGMLCALSEIDPRVVSDPDDRSIIVLTQEAPLGSDALEVLGLDERFLEVDVMPNRSEVVGKHYFCKELGAILDQPYSLPKIQQALEVGTPLSVRVETEACGYYHLSEVQGIQTIASEVSDTLRAFGEKLVHPLVDLSNYGNLMWGQPTHFFDAEKIVGTVVVTDDYQGTFIALDGRQYQIERGDLVIRDDCQVLALAGIIGGESSKVTSQTTRYCLEIGRFEGKRIRHTARRLNINTTSAINFQKNIDPQAPHLVWEYFQEVTQWEVLRSSVTNRLTLPETVISFSATRLNSYLGTSFSNEEVLSVFRRLDFVVEVQGEEYLVTIPSYRSDLTLEVDLFEEVIRLLGYHHLPSTIPMVQPARLFKDEAFSLRRYCSQWLVSLGFKQAITYSLVSEALLQGVARWELQSPLSEERRYLRTSVLPSLVQVVIANLEHRKRDLAYFELSEICGDNEYTALALVASGRWVQHQYSKQSISYDFWFFKRILEDLCAYLGIKGQRLTFEAITDSEFYHPQESFTVILGRTMLGVIGSLHPRIVQEKKVAPIVMMEVNLSLLCDQTKRKPLIYQAISKLPVMVRDITINLRPQQSYQTVKAIITKYGGTLLQEVQLIDYYQGKTGTSITCRLVFASEEQTLVADTVNQIVDTITEQLQGEKN